MVLVVPGLNLLLPGFGTGLRVVAVTSLPLLRSVVEVPAVVVVVVLPGVLGCADCLKSEGGGRMLFPPVVRLGAGTLLPLRESSGCSGSSRGMNCWLDGAVGGDPLPLLVEGRLGPSCAVVNVCCGNRVW